MQVDPHVHQVKTIRLDAGSGDQPRPEQIVVNPQGDVAWVGDAEAGRVFRLDAATLSATDTFTVSTPVTGLAVGEGGVWVSGGADDRITLLDADTGAVVTSLDLASSGCNTPGAVAVGGDSVWVACSTSPCDRDARCGGIRRAGRRALGPHGRRGRRRLGCGPARVRSYPVAASAAMRSSAGCR